MAVGRRPAERYRIAIVYGDSWPPVRLLTHRAVDRFAEEVSVAGVAGGLLDEVQRHPPEREVPPRGAP